MIETMVRILESTAAMVLIEIIKKAVEMILSRPEDK